MGAFRVQADFDGRYMLVSLGFMRQLLDYHADEVSALEIRLAPGADADKVKQRLVDELGADFQVQKRDEQHAFLYRVMRNERWVVFLILTFILIIATFNMIGSISMLVIDKRPDIGTFRAMGATEGMIRNIFFIQGLLQTLVSIGLGFGIATLLCWLQMRFGLVTIPGSGSFVITAYPIHLQWLDYLYVGLTILVIGSVTSYFPAALASRQQWLFREEG